MQNPTIRMVHMIPLDVLSLTYPYFFLIVIAKHARYALPCKKDRAERDAILTKIPDELRRVYHARILPPWQMFFQRVPSSGGEERKSRNHRPIQSTVNACLLPPLTTILTSSRAATASNGHRVSSIFLRDGGFR